MSPPRLAVTGVVRVIDGAERTLLNAGYVRSLAQAGGLPLMVSPALGEAAADAVLDGCDGLVLTGGEDVDPALYGEAPVPELGPVSRERDRFEMALFHAARRRGLPVLGICRGLQVINVALGGSLWQDLPTQRASALTHDERHGPRPELSLAVHLVHDATGPRDHRTHGIRVTPGSRLAEALGVAAFRTNSFHHQGVRRLAPGLVATAHAEDGLVEGVEGAADEPWLAAVQWHPEEFYAAADCPDQRLFRAFVAACVTTPAPLPG